MRPKNAPVRPFVARSHVRRRHVQERDRLAECLPAGEIAIDVNTQDTPHDLVGLDVWLVEAKHLGDWLAALILALANAQRPAAAGRCYEQLQDGVLIADQAAVDERLDGVIAHKATRPIGAMGETTSDARPDLVDTQLAIRGPYRRTLRSVDNRGVGITGPGVERDVLPKRYRC